MQAVACACEHPLGNFSKNLLKMAGLPFGTAFNSAVFLWIKKEIMKPVPAKGRKAFGAPGLEPGIARTPCVYVSQLHHAPLFFITQFFNALCAGFYSFAGKQNNPLEIWVFSLFDGWVVFSAKLLSLLNHHRSFFADCAFFCHIEVLYRKGVFFQVFFWYNSNYYGSRYRF